MFLLQKKQMQRNIFGSVLIGYKSTRDVVN